MGKNLFNAVIEATGLPEKEVGQELQNLLKQAGKDVDTMTLDDLRDIMAEYLQTVLLQAKDIY